MDPPTPAFVVQRIEVPQGTFNGRWILTTGIAQSYRLVYRQTIWETGQAAPLGESPCPVAFRQQDDHIWFHLAGTFQFPPRWRTPGSQYRVTGIAPTAMLQSANLDVPTTGIVSVSSFTLQNAPTNGAPFKLPVEWKWRIGHVPPPGKLLLEKTILAQTLTVSSQGSIQRQALDSAGLETTNPRTKKGQSHPSKRTSSPGRPFGGWSNCCALSFKTFPRLEILRQLLCLLAMLDLSSKKCSDTEDQRLDRFSTIVANLGVHRDIT
jgi:hypothetical protein